MLTCAETAWVPCVLQDTATLHSTTTASMEFQIAGNTVNLLTMSPLGSHELA